MGREQPVVYGIEPPVVSSRIPLMRDKHRVGCRVDRDGNIRRDGGCSAGIGNPAELERAEGCVIHSDEISHGRGRIVIVHALRGVRTRPGRRAGEVSKRGNHNRTRSQYRAFLNDECRRSAVRPRGPDPAELVHADIKRVHVNTERGIIRETCPVPRRRDQILLEKEKRPDRRCRNRVIVADGDQDTVRSGDVSRSIHRDVDDGDKPPPAQTIKSNARIAGPISVSDGIKKYVHVGIERAHRSGRFVEDADPAVDADQKLARSDGSHGIGGKGVDVGQRRAGELQSQSLGKIGGW